VTLLADGVLRFDLIYPLTPDQDVDDAAQSVWLALDVASALTKGNCDSFTEIEIVILAQGEQTFTRVSARVSLADLLSFNSGELNEDEFIQRVTYQIDDG
jgi:hypothetical protein